MHRCIRRPELDLLKESGQFEACKARINELGDLALTDDEARVIGIREFGYEDSWSGGHYEDNFAAALKHAAEFGIAVKCDVKLLRPRAPKIAGTTAQVNSGTAEAGAMTDADIDWIFHNMNATDPRDAPSRGAKHYLRAIKREVRLQADFYSLLAKRQMERSKKVTDTKKIDFANANLGYVIEKCLAELAAKKEPINAGNAGQ